MKLMTFTRELFMCVRDAIFVPHWLCHNKKVNVWMWRQNKSWTHMNWFATSVMIVFRRFGWHDKLMFCLIISFPLFWFHRGNMPLFLHFIVKSQCANVELKWDVHCVQILNRIVHCDRFSSPSLSNMTILSVDVWLYRFHIYLSSRFAHWLLHFCKKKKSMWN